MLTVCSPLVRENVAEQSVKVMFLLSLLLGVTRWGFLFADSLKFHFL